MKKLLILVLATAFFYVPNKANGQASEISSDISTFNVRQYGNTLRTTEERRWWQTVLNWVTIGAADIGGAYAGAAGAVQVAGVVGLATGGTGVAIVAGVTAVIGGAGASNAAYHGVNRGPANQINYSNLNILLPSNFSFFSLLGKQHNEVLHNNFFNGQPLSGYYTPLLDAQQISVVENIQTSQTFNFLNDLGIRYSQTGMSFESYTNELVERRLMTREGKDILSAFMEKYKVCASPRDMENLINYTITRVNTSSFDQTEKLSLIASLMVASQSPFYQVQ